MKLIRVFAIMLTMSFIQTGFSQSKQFKALLVTTTRGFHHESIHTGVLAIQQLAQKHYFDVTLLQGQNDFNDKFLQQFQVIIFLNTTGNIFDSAQQQTMERFIQSGKGFVGIHSASDTEYDWPWYTKLVGRMFVAHPPVQTARVFTVDKTFPGLQPFDPGILWTDEWYEFTDEKITGLNYLLAVDEESYSPKKKGSHVSGKDKSNLHPIAWYHEYDGGRSFYTALGHLPSVYQNQIFLDHLYAGIYWAARGKK
jgi:type 1 glutamine amidotransferase